jgi:hypothetical protein
MRLSSSIFGLLCATAASVFGGQVTLKSIDTPSYIEFAQARFEVSESETNAVVTLIRSGDYRRIASVDYATREGTATVDDDFQARGGRVVFQAGESFKEIRIPIVADQSVEAEETFAVELSAPGAYTEIVQASAEVVIKDSAPALMLNIARIEGGFVVSWPTTAAEYVLQYKGLDTAWADVPFAPEAGEGKWVLEFASDEALNLFRLRQAE